MVIDSQNLESNPQDQESIDQFLETCELKLEESGKNNATQAFNLGCTIALIPAGIIILIAYIATHTWIAAILTAILMGLAVIGFANLAAAIARTKTVERVYSSEISPAIDTYIQETRLTRAEFDSYTWENLPSSAYLLQFISQPVIPEPPRQRWPFKLNYRRKR